MANAKVTNRYRFSARGQVFTFFANNKELLAVGVNNTDDIKLEGPFLTKSNEVIDKAISQINDFIHGERKTIDLPFVENKSKHNKEIKDALSGK